MIGETLYMKLLENLAVRFLNNRNVSVMINIEFTGRVKLEKPTSYMSNCTIDGEVYDANDKLAIIPKGKFKVNYQNEEVE